MIETIQPVECGACGWKGKRKTGKTVDCPKCGAFAAFQVPANQHEPLAPASGKEQSMIGELTRAF